MDNIASLPILIPLMCGLLTLWMQSRVRLQQFIHFLGVAIYLLMVVYISWSIHRHGLLVLRLGGYPAGFAVSFVLDFFTSLMLLITAIIVLAVSVYSLADNTIYRRNLFYPAFWFMIAGVSGAFSTGDLFNLYVWFEVMIMASFVMVILSREKKYLQGCLHYVALNLLATLIMLLSISFLYGLSGTLDMASLSQWTHDTKSSEAFIFCFGALMVAFAIKSALFPYCFWLPDSYHLTSVSTGAVFAGLLTKVGVYALIRTGTLFFAPQAQFMQLLLIVSVLTMLSGVFGAMTDFNIRRILSFHIISQVGYMTLALAMGSTLALSAGIFYIIHHVLVKTNLFLIAGLMGRYNGHVDIRQMGNFFRQKPMLVILFLIPALSLAGLPPLSGFWAKYLLLQAAFASGFWLSAFMAIVVGFFTLFSMIKIWRYAFLQPTTNTIRLIRQEEASLRYLPIILLSLLTVLIGLFPQILYDVVEEAAKALLQPEAYMKSTTVLNFDRN